MIADGVDAWHGRRRLCRAASTPAIDSCSTAGRSAEFRRLEGLIACSRRLRRKRRACRGGRATSRPSRRSWRARSPRFARKPHGSSPTVPAQRLRGAWLRETHRLGTDAATVLVALFEGRTERLSEVPGPETLLVEESPHDHGLTYTFHAPLSRASCEAISRPQRPLAAGPPVRSGCDAGRRRPLAWLGPSSRRSGARALRDRAIAQSRPL